MREPMEKYFKIGTILWMSFPPVMYEKTGKNYLSTLKQVLADDFFSAIEVTQVKDDALRAEAKDLLSQSHVRVCYGAQPRLLSTGLNPNDIDEEGRQKAEDTLKAGIDEAEYLGAKAIAFLAGKWQEETKDQAYAQLLKTTVNVCKYAETKGMGVNLEVFDYDVDKAALIGPAPYAAKFAADVRNTCPNFGLLADLSHFPLTREDSRFVIQTLRPYIRHLHIGNAVVEEGFDGYGDLHPRFGFPNSANDEEELYEFLKIVREEGFFRAEDPMTLSFEVSPRPGEDPDIVLANSKRVLKRAWARLED